MLTRLQHAGRAHKTKETEETVDIEDQIQRNKEKVEKQIKEQLNKALSMKMAKKKVKRGVMKLPGGSELGEEERIRNLKMITELFSFEEIKRKDNYMVKDYKDSFYCGETNLETKHREGLGICSYYNTRHYEGSWSKDKRHGKGYERFSNGNTYLGDYVMGKVKGKGLYTWVNGDTYDGEWIDGQKHGYGVWKNC